MESRSASDARKAERAEILAMDLRERLELALRLGARDYEILAAVRGISASEARRQAEAVIAASRNRTR